MPEKKTKERARKAKREGKAPTTQAGEYVREELHHVREGKHGARSPEQAVAIGLSKARREGVEVPPPKGKRRARKTSRSRDRRSSGGQSAAARSRAAKKGAATRGAAGRSAAARKAARTRAQKRA